MPEPLRPPRHSAVHPVCKKKNRADDAAVRGGEGARRRLSVALQCLSLAFAGCLAASLCTATPPGFALAEGGEASVDGADLHLPRSILRELPAGCLQAWEPSAGGGRLSHGSMVPVPSLAVSALPAGGAPADAGDDELLENDALLENDKLLEDDELLSDHGNLLDGAASSSVDPLSSLGPPTPSDSLPAGHGHGGGYSPHAGATLSAPSSASNAGDADPHRELLLENQYPSAQTCAKCHPQHYQEWRVSGHAYAMISPMFQRFEQKITELTEGTVGHFCIRCHGPVAIQIEYPREASILDAPKIVREGITCVACHRVNRAYGRTNGLRRVAPGNIHQPVYAGSPGRGLAEAIARRKELKLKVDPTDKGPGQPIHLESRAFEPLSHSDFCASCHQVAVHPGIWLEIVHAQYRSGPAAAKGISCQDCHMGRVPGKPYGYEQSQIAELGEKPYGPPRKKSNHRFWGPGYSIAHPGLFPMNPKAERWSPRQWLAFDDRSDWGKPNFENTLAAQLAFPPPWDNTDDRRDARRILAENQRLLDEARAGSIAAMEAGAKIEGPFFDAPVELHRSLRFRYRVHNRSEGHNFPTGSLGAQPQVWLNVALIGPDGQRLWESGYLDTHGDLADLQSVDVATGKIPRDGQLFNLQTKFLVNSLRGTDREVAIPLNFNLDQLVFLRPGAVPVRVLNHPPLIRMEARSIPPRGSRAAPYRVPAELIQQPGRYRLSVRLRSRVEPSYFMRLVDCTPDMIRRMNEGILDIHPSAYTFIVK